MDCGPGSRAIAAFERATGLAVCLHSTEPRLMRAVAPDRRRYHHHAACRVAKGTRTAACLAFCGSTVQRAAATAAEPLVTRCHAGHVELVMAVRCAGEVVGVLFAGVARAGRDLAPVLVDRATLPALPTARRLPALDAEAAAWMAELLAQLALRLGAWLAHVPAAASAGPPRGAGRADLIRSWIAQHGAGSGGLAGLARLLGLSTERTRHLVADACGSSWRRQRRVERMRIAADLLDRTDLPIALIARRAGYRDHARFSASFRAWSGRTPSAWRQRG